MEREQKYIWELDAAFKRSIFLLCKEMHAQNQMIINLLASVLANQSGQEQRDLLRSALENVDRVSKSLDEQLVLMCQIDFDLDRLASEADDTQI